MAELHIVTEATEHTARVALSGDLDSYSAARARQAIEGLMTPGRDALWIDLSGLDYLDSCGLGMLIAVGKTTATRGGRFALLAPSQPAARVLRITGIDKSFPVCADEAEAERLPAP